MPGVVDLEAVRDLMVEASGLEATYGRNPYVDYLVTHKRRPPPDVAITIAVIMGGRVRADDGKMYPLPPRRPRKPVDKPRT